MRRCALCAIAIWSLTSACSDDDTKPNPGVGGAGGASGRGGAGGSGGTSAGGAGGSGGSTAGAGGTPVDSGSTGGASGSGGGGSSGSGGSAGQAADAGDTGAVDTGDAEMGLVDTAPVDTGGSATMSFFVTSVPAGMGGNLGGLDGADAKCKALAMAVSTELGAKNWKAYLSTSAVDARTRIGSGPWRNAKGVVIANSVAQLHEEGGMTNMIRPSLTAPSNALDERGMTVPMGGGATGVHDTLTGSTAMGTRDPMNRHCNNWTSMSMTDTAVVGHHDRAGSSANATSWNSAHATGGCAPVVGNQRNGTVGSGGGRGSIYCFAAD
jgi:hypothetical protein